MTGPARLRRTLGLLAALLATAGIALLLSSSPEGGPSPLIPGKGGGGRAAPGAGPGREAVPADGDAAPGRPAAQEEAAAVAALRRALESGDGDGARRAAADLRRILRGDPGARRRAASQLVAGDTPATLRQALALILGTIEGPDTDALLREALERFAGDPAFARCALLALGAAREPEEDDDVFGVGDQPWGEPGPGGLGIRIRRTVGDAETRAALGRGLDRPEPEVREAAASALRHSLDAADARASFLAAVALERSDVVAPVLGEALAERAGVTEDAGERRVLVSALLARAGTEGLDGFRFRMENDFHRIALEGPDRAALEELAAESKPFGIRAFAMTVLLNAAPRGGGEAEAAARALLERFTAGDRDPAVRDLAARLLGRLPPGEGTVAVLLRAAKEDPAWNVRFSALDALAAGAPRETAVAALKAARADPDSRVAAEAGKLLKRLAPDGD